jgi:hypothetical protein
MLRQNRCQNPALSAATPIADKGGHVFNGMAKLRRQLSPFSGRNVPLTRERFASLKHAGDINAVGIARWH